MAKENKLTTTFVKKFKLHPVPVPDNKKWVKKVNMYFDYLLSKQDEAIENYTNWIIESDKQKAKDRYTEAKEKAIEKKDRIFKEKKKFNAVISNGARTKEEIEFLKKTAIRYTKDFIEKCCISEAERKNASLSYVYSRCLETGLYKITDKKERNKKILELFNFCNRVKSKVELDTPNSLLDILDIENPLAGYGFMYCQVLKSAFVKAIDDGLFQGKITLPSYRMDTPLSIAKDFITLFPSFDMIGVHDYRELQNIIQKENGKVYLHLGSNGKATVAKFELNFGAIKKSRADLYALIFALLNKDYELCGSSIQYDIQHKDIYINLTIKKPIDITQEELDEKTIVGVDVGINTPAVCALNNDSIPKKYIGDKEELLRVRKKYDDQKSRILNKKKYITNESKIKIQPALSRITQGKEHWKRNINHLIARRVVEFALSNNAKYIHLENLSKYSSIKKSNVLLNEWSYFELQNFIEYKAKQCGITVRYVKPDSTSDTCSCCGNKDNTERIKTTHKNIFVCHNPDCPNKGKKVNADYNAARNIAMATPKKK